MAISIFGINDSSNWIKKISWRGVFFVSTCFCTTLYSAPSCILHRLGLGDLEVGTRRWIGCIGLVSAFAFVYCIAPLVRKSLMQWVGSLEWKGENAKKKIMALSILAKEEIREHINGASFQLYGEGEIYKELLGGNFIEVLPPKKGGIMVNCKLKKWVLECFIRYPHLVEELPEKDAATREADQDFQ